jgi:hypothetical protein
VVFDNLREFLSCYFFHFALLLVVCALVSRAPVCAELFLLKQFERIWNRQLKFHA